MKYSLPDSLLAWVSEIGAGEISRLERHTARREAWVVDVTRRDGTILEGFLRVDRKPDENRNTSLRREARVCEVLHELAFPVPELYGWNEAHHAALFSRVEGTADIHKLEDSVQQRAVMEDFIDVIARLHQLSPQELGLGNEVGPMPESARACALDDVDRQCAAFKGFLDHYNDPLMRFGISWLRRNAPTKVDRICLVQGDTGPVNFMFKGSSVSAVVDWEWAHWGDPMEDLGNICVRESMNPSGGLAGLFKRYQEKSGITYSREAAMYYRVQQNMRGMIPIHYITEHGSGEQSYAWFICYRYLIDRMTCEAIAEAMNIELEKPDLPIPEADEDLFCSHAIANLEDDVLPHLDDQFARSRLRDAQLLIQCYERKSRYEKQFKKQLCEEIGQLLGNTFSAFEEAGTALTKAIETLQVSDDKVIKFLYRKACIDEWVYYPAVSLYPNTRWSDLD